MREFGLRCCISILTGYDIFACGILPTRAPLRVAAKLGNTMKRTVMGSIVVVVLISAVVLSNVGGGGGLITFFPKEERNPVTHLRWNDAPEEFRFAIVSDRTGAHRDGIFSQAVEKLNLMQPEFVLSVGDLIEGGNK